MRNRCFWLVPAVCVLLPAVAAAADASGRWKAEFSTPDGTARVNTFTFKVDGVNLTVVGRQLNSGPTSRSFYSRSKPPATGIV
jgi:hypothetical protein